jgi:pimeloyl-ACP methyl ester carboxylesterase
MEGVMPQLEVNGAELYYEVRGGGPPVLLIMGFTGDAGHFETLAGALASEFTVISYDRRGNGRSPRPPGWAATRPEEQADDAAALLARSVYLRLRSSVPAPARTSLFAC